MNKRFVTVVSSVVFCLMMGSAYYRGVFDMRDTSDVESNSTTDKAESVRLPVQEHPEGMYEANRTTEADNTIDNNDTLKHDPREPVAVVKERVLPNVTEIEKPKQAKKKERYIFDFTKSIFLKNKTDAKRSSGRKNSISEIIHGKANYKQITLQDNMKKIGVKKGDSVYLRIFKKERLLELWMLKQGKYHLVYSYPICAYSGKLGPKLKEGDKQSPEGFYNVDYGMLNPNSHYHLSFNLGYPNEYDRSRGRTGSYLMVHGKCVSIGCYAMTDGKIEEIYGLVESALLNGQDRVPVHIFPFRLNNANINKYKKHKWYNFWQNLKEGYEMFEQSHLPPGVETEDKRYIFY